MQGATRSLPHQHVLLHEAAGREEAADLGVLQAARALMQVDERGQVLVDGLVDFIEVVPDGRIGGVHLAHGIGVSGSDRAEQAIGDAVHLGLGEC